MSGGAPIASRSFDLSDQKWFAQLSGDWNPLHVDAVAARRTQAGEPAVHGVHGMLWALDQLCRHMDCGPIARIDVQFDQFILLNRQVAVTLISQDSETLVLHVSSDGIIATIITLTLGPLHSTATDELGDGTVILGPERQDIHVYSPIQLNDLSGSIAHAQATDEYGQAFPHLAAKIEAPRIASLATVTRLVGMVSPGLHSIFLGLTIDLTALENPRDGIRFAVTQVNRRFRHITMSVSGDGLAGTVACLVRQPPVQQATLSELQGWVAPDAFAGSTALIVGGSRGLGELTAKLIAAGGGETILTYAMGQDDAARIADEINQAGGKSNILHLDVRQDIAGQLAHLAQRPTHCYYFASPRIGRQKSSLFSGELLADFLAVYVDAFYQLCTALSSKEHPVQVLYPSTVFVDKRPRNMTEYAMAKSAGEVLCDDISAYVPGIQIFKPRLPRVPTDQTALAVAMLDMTPALDVMKPIILQLQLGQSQA